MAEDSESRLDRPTHPPDTEVGTGLPESRPRGGRWLKRGLWLLLASFVVVTVAALALVIGAGGGDVVKAACETGTGTSLDLSQEPESWVLAGTWTRWEDSAGCPVRLDVISDTTGPAHCDMDNARFLNVGRPVGSIPEPPTARSYVFDPDRTLGDIGHGKWGAVVGLDAVPASAVDSGYRSARGLELWTDPADSEYVWLIRGVEVQSWRQAAPDQFNCA